MRRCLAFSNIAGMQQEPLTYEQAARLVHVSPETIRYWIKTDRLPTVPARISKRSGKPYGKRVYADDVRAATERGLIEKLQRAHPDLHLLTVNETAAWFGVRPHLVRQWIETFNVTRIPLHPGSRSFVISLTDLLDGLSQDFFYSAYAVAASERNRKEACACKYCLETPIT